MSVLSELSSLSVLGELCVLSVLCVLSAQGLTVYNVQLQPPLSYRGLCHIQLLAFQIPHTAITVTIPCTQQVALVHHKSWPSSIHYTAKTSNYTTYTQVALVYSSPGPPNTGIYSIFYHTRTQPLSPTAYYPLIPTIAPTNITS